MTSLGGKKKIFIIGSTGFLGKNLEVRLRQFPESYDVNSYSRSDDSWKQKSVLDNADVVFFFAAVNREEQGKIYAHNIHLCSLLIAALKNRVKPVLLIFTSSTKAMDSQSEYGCSKLESERLLVELSRRNNNVNLLIQRLPNLFGKWSRPNHNSVVANFCYGLINGCELSINSDGEQFGLAYIDQVIDNYIEVLLGEQSIMQADDFTLFKVNATDLYQRLKLISEYRNGVDLAFLTDRLDRLLYATYLSYLNPEAHFFSIGSYRHEDLRGIFAEFVRPPIGSQISVVTVNPGEVRGQHFHDSKIERFLVVSGNIEFSTTCVRSGRGIVKNVDAGDANVFESIPGYIHALSNVTDMPAVAIIWTSEIFDPLRPDTYTISI